MTKSRLMGILFSSLGFIIGMEIALRIVDPLGIHVYMRDGKQLQEAVIPHNERGYVYEEGTYNLTRVSAQINEDHSRYVPDSGQGDCTIAFVGDSFTFALGVSDDESWVNWIAQDYPDVTMINAGTPGYNAEQVYQSVLDIPVDGYVYLIFDNDMDKVLDIVPDTGFNWRRFHDSAIVHYWTIITKRQPEKIITETDDVTFSHQDWESFYHHLALLEEMENVFMFVLGEGDWKDNYYQIPSLGRDYMISPFDAHADPAGNEYIASQISPRVGELIADVCDV